MKRVMCLAILLSHPGFSQIGAPRIGFVRTAAGPVRALDGVAGSFTIGDQVLEKADRLWFDGRRGLALTSTEKVSFNVAGRVVRRQPLEDDTDLPDPGATFSGDEVKIRATGMLLRMPFEILSVERAGAEYLVVRGERSCRLVRMTAGRETQYELPEVKE